MHRGSPLRRLLRSGAADAALKVVVFGCIHGDETAGMRVARRLITPGAPRRVELNRNFPFDWTQLSGGECSGTGPLSEPESRAGRRFLSQVQPDLTIWFHQPFGIVDRSRGDPFVERRFADLAGPGVAAAHML